MYIYIYICIYIYIYIYKARRTTACEATLIRGGVLLTKMPLPRIARQGAACQISMIRGIARTARIEKSELDEAVQPCHPPFRVSEVHK